MDRVTEHICPCKKNIWTRFSVRIIFIIEWDLENILNEYVESKEQDLLRDYREFFERDYREYFEEVEKDYKARVKMFQGYLKFEQF